MQKGVCDSYEEARVSRMIQISDNNYYQSSIVTQATTIAIGPHRRHRCSMASLAVTTYEAMR